VLACAATYPLDLVRTRLATQTTTLRYSGVIHCLSSIHAAEGVRGLYRGLGPTLVGVAPSLAMNFAVYETLRVKIARVAPASAAPALALAAGSASGAVSAIVCFPLDLVRRRMQLLPPPGEGGARVAPLRMLDVARGVAARDGLRGFYRCVHYAPASTLCSTDSAGRSTNSGIVPELAKVVPGVGIAFSTYELAKQKLGCDS